MNPPRTKMPQARLAVFEYLAAYEHFKCYGDLHSEKCFWYQLNKATGGA